MKTTKTSLCLTIIMILIAVATLSCSTEESSSSNFYVIKPFSSKDYPRPILIKDFILSSHENKIYLREKLTGRVKWTYEFENNVIGTPVTDNTFIYAVTPHELVSIDIETGNEVWKKESTSEFTSELFYYKENLYIIGPERLYSIASKLEEPKQNTSESVGQVHINQILYDYNMISDKIGAVVDIKTDTAFMVLFENETNKFSRIVAIKLSGYNMKQKWSYSSGNEINSILSIDEDGKAIYFTSLDGSVHSLDTESGKVIFSSPKPD